MKFAIIGGTHGNELVGVEVARDLEKEKPQDIVHSYKVFYGNPLAIEKGLRFIDCDLNRTFGKNGVRLGHEGERSKELEKEIMGHYDFLIDLHTTTSNMGDTLILNRNDEKTLKAACFLKRKFPDTRLIKAACSNDDCPYTGAMVESGLTIEVGPVANNIVRSHLYFTVYNMVVELLKWNFDEEIDFSDVEYYQTIDDAYYPKGEGWLIHQNIECQRPFTPLKKGDPQFIHKKGDIKYYEGEEALFPFFVNEAAYQSNGIAMSLGVLRKGL